MVDGEMVTDEPVLRLVGAVQTGGEEFDIEWFGRVFGRLGDEVKHAGDVMRYVGYEGFAGDRCEVRFLGLEVQRIEDVPDGMVGWELRDDSWTVTQPDGSISRRDITWKWLDRSGRTVGEWTSLGESSLDFRMSQNAYVERGVPCDDEVRLVDYDPSWPAKYEEMAGRLREGLGDAALKIEHYGSTAITGMPAKPVIDILVEVPSFEVGRRRAIPYFNRRECEYWWYRDHMCFVVRERPMGKRTHHVHAAPAGHRLWEGIAFCDYMRSHSEEAARYAALKHDLAADHRTDREAYTDAKTAFVREIMVKARMRNRNA